MRKIYTDKGIMLVPLPFGYGLNIGWNFSGYWSIRTWAWAVYDFADHVPTDSRKSLWADMVLQGEISG
jgi:hypothetical protein